MCVCIGSLGGREALLLLRRRHRIKAAGKFAQSARRTKWIRHHDIVSRSGQVKRDTWGHHRQSLKRSIDGWDGLKVCKIWHYLESLPHSPFLRVRSLSLSFRFARAAGGSSHFHIEAELMTSWPARRRRRREAIFILSKPSSRSCVGSKSDEAGLSEVQENGRSHLLRVVCLELSSHSYQKMLLSKQARERLRTAL